MAPHLQNGSPEDGSITGAPASLTTSIVFGGSFLLLIALLLMGAARAEGGVLETSSASAAEAPRYNSQTLPLAMPTLRPDNEGAKGGGGITVVGSSALLAQAGPLGTITTIENLPQSSQISVYTVHDGDSLGEIARMFGVSVNTIAWANNIKNGIIHPGDELIILPVTGVRYTVAKGDTVASIAKKYKADANEIALYNDIAEGVLLAAGDTIIIPDGEVTPPPAPVRTSAGTTPLTRGGNAPVLSGYFLTWPLETGTVTQGLHGYNGTDIGAPPGTPIYAAAAGVVIIAKIGGWNGGYGNYVVVVHDNGTQTLYAHASAVLVTAGTRVSQGQTIALVGSSGNSTGNHLHYEVRGAHNPVSDYRVGTRH